MATVSSQHINDLLRWSTRPAKKIETIRNGHRKFPA